MQQVVINTATTIVLRAGFCDFATDGSFDPATETILVEGVDYAGDVYFDPPLSQAQWTWDGSGFVAGKPLPDVKAVVQLKSPDDSVWNITVDDDGALTTTRA